MGDDDNRYLPPKAVVEDPEPDTSERPISVWIAVMLIALLILQDTATAARSAVAAFRDSELFIPVLLSGILLFGEITSAIFIARGRNWSRFLYLLIMIFELAMSVVMLRLALRLAPESFYAVFDWRYFALSAAPHVVSIVALVLVFGPGRAWFRRHR